MKKTPFLLLLFSVNIFSMDPFSESREESRPTTAKRRHKIATKFARHKSFQTSDLIEEEEDEDTQAPTQKRHKDKERLKVNSVDTSEGVQEEISPQMIGREDSGFSSAQSVQLSTTPVLSFFSKDMQNTFSPLPLKPPPLMPPIKEAHTEEAHIETDPEDSELLQIFGNMVLEPRPIMPSNGRSLSAPTRESLPSPVQIIASFES